MRTLLAVFLASFLPGGLATAADTVIKPGDMLAYVGTYTTGASKGIYLYRVNPGVDGAKALETLGVAAETPSPSFLAVDARRRLLFAVNETSQYEGKPSGSVSAFSIDAATGKLTLLNQKATNGTAPCHLMLDRSGRNLLIANYSSGSVTVIRVAADGHLGEISSLVQHTGSSVHPTRQKGPHAHDIAFDPSGQFVFVCDLGADRVMTYRLDADSGKLTPANPAFTALKPGSGPRHMTFRPDGKFAYVISELASTLTTFAFDATTGALREVQTVSTLPAGYTGSSTTAEVQVSASGKFLYGSNRGHDSLATFAIDPAAGTLRLVGHAPTGGRTPRHFNFDPAGGRIFACNQDGNSIQVSTVNPSSGELTAGPGLVQVPAPVCIVFFQP